MLLSRFVSFIAEDDNLKIIALIVLLILNGYFSMVESAMVSANDNIIKMMADAGNEKAVSALYYIENKFKILASVRVYIYLTLLISFALTIRLIAPPFELVLADYCGKYSGICANFVIIVVFALISLLVCELIPKRMGIKNAENILFGVSGILKRICMPVRPIAFVINGIANCAVRAFGINPEELDNDVTEEEIRMMVDAGGDSGSIDESEKEMINNIFEFDNTMVGDIATHRTEIVAIPITSTVQEVIDVINKEKFSRIPVYEESIDNIVGIFHVKDMVKCIISNDSEFKESFDLRDILMKPFFVPFSKKTDELFEEMQKNKSHMAIVIDEYGGTAGLVTMEDLLEEIVGNIFDEYDDIEEEITSEGDDFVIKGTTPLKEVEELFNIEFENSDDYDTLGGFLIGHIGRIPDEGEKPEVKIGSLVFKVVEIEDKRIELVRVSR